MIDLEGLSVLLPTGWSPLSDVGAMDGLRERLLEEMPDGHVLWPLYPNLMALARDEASDDVLFATTDTPRRWFRVHLTWAGRQTAPQFPWTVEIDGPESLAEET